MPDASLAALRRLLGARMPRPLAITRCIHRLCLLIVALMIGCEVSLAHADDVLTVRFVPGMPRFDLSTEITNVRIERQLPARGGAPSGAVDDFFNAVRRVLSENDVAGDWTFTGPDASYIEITIELDGKRIRLISWHTLFEHNSELVATERGIEALNGRERSKVLSQQDEKFLKNRRAFEQLLTLVSERLHARLSVM
jgi:hypothetical protein